MALDSQTKQALSNIGRRGGIESAKNLTAEQRKARALKANAKRWPNRKEKPEVIHAR